MHYNRYTDDNIEHENYKNDTQKTKTLSSSKELTSWVKLTAACLTKDFYLQLNPRSLEDDNIKYIYI